MYSPPEVGPRDRRYIEKCQGIVDTISGTATELPLTSSAEVWARTAIVKYTAETCIVCVGQIETGNHVVDDLLGGLLISVASTEIEVLCSQVRSGYLRAELLDHVR
jgi:hypothetical protein